jgi:hypothetical protein
MYALLYILADRLSSDCADGRVFSAAFELPEATAKAARDAGLLTPQELNRLLTDALERRQAADSLLAIADRVEAAGIEPMSMQEINAEVKATRAERRRRSQAA